LHASSRYTSEYPKGDEGGNGYTLNIKGFEDVTNLHALWDSVLLTQTKDMTLPLSDQNWELLGNLSASLRSQYSPLEVEVLTGSSHDWAEESYRIVREEIYSQIHQGQYNQSALSLFQMEDGVVGTRNGAVEPSQEYLEKSRSIAEKQLVRAA
jgi:hypothetical protein